MLVLTGLPTLFPKLVAARTFAGRWARATDRQRTLLSVVAGLERCDEEFSVQEVIERSHSFAVPMLGGYVRRRTVEQRG